MRQLMVTLSRQRWMPPKTEDQQKSKYATALAAEVYMLHVHLFMSGVGLYHLPARRALQ
jgi:hypothetical protein